MSVPIIDTSHDSHDEDDEYHTKNPFHDELESEIARMSQDTDAILDSIRKAAAPTPSKRSKRSLHALLEIRKRAAQQEEQNRQDDDHSKTSAGTDTDDVDDDDMTDDGSVPEEVRRKIQEELDSLDTKFNSDPDGISEEIRHVSFEANFMNPANGGCSSGSGSGSITTDGSTGVKKEDGDVPKSDAISMINTDPRGWLRSEVKTLVLFAVMVWTVILLMLIRAIQHGLLDEHGFLVLPFAVLLGSSSS